LVGWLGSWRLKKRKSNTLYERNQYVMDAQRRSSERLKWGGNAKTPYKRRDGTLSYIETSQTIASSGKGGRKRNGGGTSRVLEEDKTGPEPWGFVPREITETKKDGGGGVNQRSDRKWTFWLGKGNQDENGKTPVRVGAEQKPTGGKDYQRQDTVLRKTLKCVPSPEKQPAKKKSHLVMN